MKPRYVNPFTDFGFKKLFGEEASKPQLMDFLNALLPGHARIKDLTFRNNEQLGSALVDRKARSLIRAWPGSSAFRKSIS